MNRAGFYTSGEFARMAHVTLRTIRYYDKVGLLPPSRKSESGARLYTGEDFAKLQQILLFKYLGFSLEDIREMTTLTGGNSGFLLGSLDMQKRLVEERVEQLKEVSAAISKTQEAVKSGAPMDWTNLLNLIHMTAMENSLKVQYDNAANIQARIRLHRDYSNNPKGWFPFLYEEAGIRPGMKVLEVGAGSGALWKENLERLPQSVHITLSDKSSGMVHDLSREFAEDARFTFQVSACEKIPSHAGAYDRVIANHVLFYCDPLQDAISECARVVKDEGVFLCSTYGRNHMREITELVKEYNPDIVLSADSLYEKFGLENGEALLKPCFHHVELHRYVDAIEIADPDPLIAYILSCHGNQNSFLLDQYKDFREFVTKKVRGGFHITKDAGVFVCRKQG